MDYSMEKKSATALINEMKALQAKLALTHCRCCGRKLDIYVQELHPKSTRTPSTIGTCRNETCARFTITREISDLYNLTNEQMAQFKQAIANRESKE